MKGVVEVRDELRRSQAGQDFVWPSEISSGESPYAEI
jgi:hypothetical protein